VKISDKEHLSDEVEIVVARSVGEIERIRPIWEKMQKDASNPVVNANIDRYLSLVEVNDGAVRPCIILIKQHGQPIAMAIGRLEEHPIEVKLGYKTLLSPKLRCLTIVYGGILGQPGKEVCSLLVGELMTVLRRGEVDVVYFSHLRTDSSIYEAARKLPGVLNRGHFPRIETHWSMTLPEDIELFYQARSKKHRANLKRYIRKLETEYPNEIRVVTYTREDHLDEAIRAAADISRFTYQHGLACGFADDSKTRILLRTAARRGWLCMAVLFINGEAAAFQLGVHYGKDYMLAQIGFDPKWTPFQIGTVLFLKVLEDLCADPDIESIDFGFGDADYKRSYADKQWREASVYIFAVRVYPIIINIVRTFTLGLNRGLECVLNRTGALGWVKRRWRNLLQARKDNRH